MTQQVPWLAQAARMTDFPIVEVDGWRSRGHGGMDTLEGVGRVGFQNPVPEA